MTNLTAKLLQRTSYKKHSLTNLLWCTNPQIYPNNSKPADDPIATYKSRDIKDMASPNSQLTQLASCIYIKSDLKRYSKIL
jgi:hypothetical protein